MREVERILRVDHAGEAGAIKIYSAQLMVSKLLYKDITGQLVEMLSHEKEHFITFDRLLVSRGVRSCHALWLWSLGGTILGLFTALLGRRAIWVCTNAIESTVLHHLEWQLGYLKSVDSEAYHAVLSIKDDEEQHQSIGHKLGSESVIYKPIYWLVGFSTKVAIWLSTKL